jgi:hypothetical protein
MAYDRYDTRDERSHWSDDRGGSRDSAREQGRDRGDWGRDDRYEHGGRGGRDERGFFERAGDEIASWFGDDDAERRRREDQMRDERERGWGSRNEQRHPERRPEHAGDRNRDYDRGYGRDRDRDRGRDWNENRGVFSRGGSSERDYNSGWRRNLQSSGDRDHDRDRDRGYRPVTGDYGRGSPDHESGQFFAASGYGRGERGMGDYDRDYDRSQSRWGRDDYRRTSFAGSRERNPDERPFDPH